MLIIDSPSTDPHFNIAAEEYLLKETGRDYAFFYINDPSIIIGKHQNAWAEINLPWTRQNNIPVVRRISGGGTVWHDEGNINFSFILTGEEGKLVNFREYATPVLDFLRGIGLPAEFGERNEILIDGLKISGNAEHVFRKRVLHHGTLLFSSDLTMLREALDTNPDEYGDKAVQSVRSRTGNIADFLSESMSVSDFRNRLTSHIKNHFKNQGKYGTDEIEYMLSETDRLRIEELVKEKYSLWKWNIGYSPKYSLSRDIEIDKFTIRAEIHVEKGQIKNCSFQIIGYKSKDTKNRSKLHGDLSGDYRGFTDLAMHMTGINHDPDTLRDLVSSRNLIEPSWIDILIEGLF